MNHRSQFGDESVEYDLLYVLLCSGAAEVCTLLVSAHGETGIADLKRIKKQQLYTEGIDQGALAGTPEHQQHTPRFKRRSVFIWRKRAQSVPAGITVNC